MKGKLAIIVLIAICLTIFVSCGNNEKSQIEEIQKKLNESNSIIEQLEQKLSEKQKEIDQLKALQNKSEIKGKDSQVQDVRLIYISPDNYEKVFTKNIVTIDNEKTLEENVTKVIDATMTNFFKNNKYEIAFKKEREKDIVALNLIDESDSRDWYNTFQGSTGGYINSNIIIENILQREYEGKWIDGFKILYNGKTAEFQHAPDLQDVIYR